MGYTKRKCDNCGTEYNADNRNLKRGWGLTCSKSCAASKREKSKPSYKKERVEANNIRRALWNEKIHDSDYTHKVTGYTSEGYKIIGGVAYNEWDEPVYNIDPNEDSHNHGQWL